MALKALITAMLPEKYQTLGYSLTEDEDFVYLVTPDKESIVFSSHGATMQKINESISERETQLNTEDYWKHLGNED